VFDAFSFLSRTRGISPSETVQTNVTYWTEMSLSSTWVGLSPGHDFFPILQHRLNNLEIVQVARSDVELAAK
jgi:hypothetical protein